MCELLEIAREKQGNISYYELAKRLEISTPLMHKWRYNKSQPNGLNTLKLAEMAGLTTSEAIAIYEKGFSRVSLNFMTSLGCGALLYWKHAFWTMYIMLNQFKRKEGITAY
jgi:transcriptional regulator with XRE-family HTH domain